MLNTNSTYPNEVIFVKQQNSFNLPKEETEYLVEKRNDFDEIEKLIKFFPVKDGTIELKITSPEYSKSYKHGDIYNISKKKIWWLQRSRADSWNRLNFKQHI